MFICYLCVPSFCTLVSWSVMLVTLQEFDLVDRSFIRHLISSEETKNNKNEQLYSKEDFMRNNNNILFQTT